MVRQDLICAALLGYSHDEFVNSKEYLAFKDGFDLHVTSSIPSLSEVCRPLIPVHSQSQKPSSDFTTKFW